MEIPLTLDYSRNHIYIRFDEFVFKTDKRDEGNFRCFIRKKGKGILSSPGARCIC